MLQVRDCISIDVRDFLKEEYPKKTVQEEPDEKKRKEFNAEQKAKITEKLATFTKPGNPGVKFKKVYDKMLANLELPKHVKEQLGLSPVVPADKPGDKPSEEKKVPTDRNCRARHKSQLISLLKKGRSQGREVIKID